MVILHYCLFFVLFILLSCVVFNDNKPKTLEQKAGLLLILFAGGVPIVGFITELIIPIH